MTTRSVHASHQEFPQLVKPFSEKPGSLSDRQAHLWWTSPDQFTDQDELDRYRALLTEDERQKIDGFRFAADRHLTLISRVLVRTTLSRYGCIPAERWRFRRNDHGRPEIASPVSALRFNLSHTRGLVTCLVSRERTVGVDVEPRDREGRWLELADRFFSVREAEALRRIAESERPQRFLEYWTLKESYIKARGLGLAIPLRNFSFDLPTATPDDVRMHIDGAINDQPARWQFGLYSLGKRHLVATAVEREAGTSTRIATHETVGPLA